MLGKLERLLRPSRSFRQPARATEEVCKGAHGTKDRDRGFLGVLQYDRSRQGALWLVGGPRKGLSAGFDGGKCRSPG